MATDKDDIISDGKLFHKNAIMLKYEFRKREVLQGLHEDHQNWKEWSGEEAG